MLSAVSLLLLSLLSPGLQAADEEPAPVDADALHRRYGFDGLIVSKFTNGLFGMQAADVNGDGHGDMAFVNNNKAKIELLVHRGDQPLEDEELELVNELPDEAHFLRESLATEQKVWALAMADLDADGRADAVFTGDSGKLTVAYAGDDSSFERRVRYDLDDGLAHSDSLHVGDLEGDGRPDVIVFTERTTELFLTDGNGRLKLFASLPNATVGADGFDVADLDGDGLLDLLYVSAESDWPLRYRLGQPAAGFGPEMRSRFSAIRGHVVADLDGDGRAEVVVIGRRSGRATVLRLAPSEDAQGDLPLSALRIVPFPSVKDVGKRDAVVADIDRDGYPDVVLADPSAARLAVYHGDAGGQFQLAKPYPSLFGSSSPRVGDLDDDGLLDIVLGAAEENSVAVAAVDADGAISFPETLGAPGGDLLGLDVGDVDGDGVAEVWVVVGDGRGRSRDRTVRRLGEGGPSFEVDVAADPSDLLLRDLDRDGKDDLILIVPTELPHILLSRDGDPQLVDSKTPGLGILQNVSRAALFHGDVDGDGTDELLVPGSNFARALHLDGDGNVQVVAQYNLEQAAAQVQAVAAAQLDGEGKPEILVVDASRNRLVILGQEDDRVTTRAQVDLGGFSPLGLLPTDIDRDGRSDVLLWDRERFATVLVGGQDLEMVAGHSYESPVKDAYLDSMAAGDVNGDGQSDLVFTETRKHLMHVAAVQPDALAHALKFPVFESRMFESSRRSSREPREVIVADFTGDALPDIAILVHDRVIVYPQEPAR